MRHRRLLFYGILTTIIIAAVAAVVIWILSAPAEGQLSTSSYSRFGVGQLVTQMVLSFLTLCALFWSLCGKALKTYLHGPELKLVVANDAMHCGLDDAAPIKGPSGSKQPVLSVYAHVENSSKAEATSCQLISNRIYVSADGFRFHPYKTWQTASYKWLYEPGERPYVACVRNSVEKYARIVTIVQQDDTAPSKETTEGISRFVDEFSVSADKTSWFMIQMPIAHFATSEFGISVSPQYHAILLPITIACAEAVNTVEYVKIVWRGNSVSDYRMPGMLSIEVVSRDEASNMIAKEVA